MKRPWIPIAVVLALLIASTLVIGSVMRSRLADAEASLDPYLDTDVIASINGAPDLPTPPCGRPDEIAAALREFSRAVEEDRATAEENGEDPALVITTDPTFDSFLLRSSTARLTAGRQQLLLRARPSEDGWCVADATFQTEE